MFVIKRSGQKELVSFDKVLRRIQKLVEKDPPLDVDLYDISREVINRIHNDITTVELDEFAASLCSSKITTALDYDTLAVRIAVSNLHKQTRETFSSCVSHLFAHNLVSEEFYTCVCMRAAVLDAAIVHERDYTFDFFGIETLKRSYLMRIENKIVERPQYMLMRVAVGMHGTNSDAAIETYSLMSQKYFIHATPTLYNAGTARPQLSSCFILDVEDSIEGIFGAVSECANISKYAGGIGLNFHNIRARNSYIAGTNGYSNGIVPFLRVFNNTARAVDQGGGKRKGSFAVYLEPWHADIEDFISLRLPQGDQEMRCRDLFLALWVNDLFMSRVRTNGVWSLMDPAICTELTRTYGKEFEKLYADYERRGMYIKQIPARGLWDKIIASQIESGLPYICYKDQVNYKSNMRNYGVIKSSNLCAEINIYCDEHETAVCNLASIALPTFVETKDIYVACIETWGSEKMRMNSFNYEKLIEVTKVVTRNLNKVIDVNFYPDKKTETSNKKHRPIGIGIQGLADTFIKMGLAFDSAEAKALNARIMETIYYAALCASNELAREQGAYATFSDSPMAEGIFQFDLWKTKPSTDLDWESLRASIVQYGLRNSLLTSLMPTASTSQILGFNECFEPFTSNIYTRKTLSGTFTVVNKYLVRELKELGLWNARMKDSIIENDGSVQNIASIPAQVKNLYKTVWEIKQRALIDLAADRGPFVCQSQSMNLFLADPSIEKIHNMHMYAWKKGLKTGLYYLRTLPRAQAQKFTIRPKCEPTCDVCSA